MKDNPVKRECEIKYKINSFSEETGLLQKLAGLDFIPEIERRELDFVPDTPDSKCKQNGLLLRFRRIIQSGGFIEILLTLKIKRNNASGNRQIAGIKDVNEVQFYFSKPDLNKLIIINEYLSKANAFVLPTEILDISDFKNLKTYAKELGYSRLRAFNEKKRREFKKGKINITIDEFPENVGKYMEIETETPGELFKSIRLFGLDKDKLITTNYGDIIKQAKSNLSDTEQRTCLFEDSLSV
jgi:adenylate cyclase class IV